MKLDLLIDFGSTYTKVVAVDPEREEVVATSKAPTTIDTDIMAGLEKATSELVRNIAFRPGRNEVAGEGEVPGAGEVTFGRRLACSSAGGGLRMVAVGLVPDLTVEAARRAALGAGARILSAYSYELTRSEVGQILDQCPDIILLAGGTDGGNRDIILHNAKALAGSVLEAPIIIAGNKVAAGPAFDILSAAGKDARVTENVMPKLGVLNVEPARALIRQVFMERIVVAKGLNKAEEFVEGIVMPTPAAVLDAALLLAGGTADEDGLGDLVIIDIGGATTDVHSIAEGHPTRASVMQKGLPEPFAKRTVEGDLGVRVSASSLVESVGERKVGERIGIPGLPVKEAASFLARHTEKLPATEEDFAIDRGFAEVAAEFAMNRHAGRIEVAYTPLGATYVQYGKDLTEVLWLIGTGGPVIYGREPVGILKRALFDGRVPMVLKPRRPGLLIDEDYILAAMGLLSGVNPGAALRIMKKSLKEVG